MTSPALRLARMVLSDPEAALRLAARIDTDAKAKSARHRVRAAPRLQAKRESKVERLERISAIRDEVFRLCLERCEACMTHDATDLHHVLGGGLRRHREAEETCVALCRRCHGIAESPTICRLLLDNVTRLSSEARKSLHHRIDKNEGSISS